MPTIDRTCPIGQAVPIRSHKIIKLGPMRVEIRSNEFEFAGLRFFSELGNPPGLDPPDFILSLCNLTMDGPWPQQELASRRDRNYRAKRMLAGYYLTDHFGAPAYLISRGRHYWIFAEDFAPILWPYAVKYLLTLYSVDHQLLHLKAAGVVIDGRGALLIGRGGSGKTVLLNQLCRAGADFLANTHVLVGEHQLIGTRTALRVRPDEFFAPVIEKRRLSSGVVASEYTADPVSDLEWSSAESAPMGSVCLIDYKGSGHREIREIERDTLFDYMEQFSLALNVYGLKEDLLDALGGDIPRFVTETSRMRSMLRALVDGSRCYYVSCDAAEPTNLRAIGDLLRMSDR